MIPASPALADCARLEALLARPHPRADGAPLPLCRVVDKTDSDVARFLGRFLSLLGVQSEETFLASYATTIPDPAGKAVALVMIPEAWSAPSRFDVLIHEATHAVQIATDGAIPFALSYLASQYDRAIYEATAYGTALELAAERGQSVPDVGALAEHLRGYACEDGAISACRVALGSWARSVAAGVRSEIVAAVAAEWR